MKQLFEGLSDDAHLWIHAADRDLTDAEATELGHALHAFKQDWTSHGRPVESQWQLVGNRVLLISAEVPQADLSGCGIDKSLHAIEAFAADSGFSWVDGLTIVYRDSAGRVRTTDRATFRALGRSGEVTGETLVIDVSIRRLDTVRSVGLEQKAARTWHAKLIDGPGVTA